MEWFLIIPGILLTALIAVAIWYHFYVMRFYVPVTMRIFQEKPLFILPFGKPVPNAEEITRSGRALRCRRRS